MLEKPVQPDWEGLVKCILRQGTPQRVHNIELFLDGEVQDVISKSFGLLDDLNADDLHFEQKKQVRLQRFLGYDYVRQGIEGLEMPLHHIETGDTAQLPRSGGRSFVELNSRADHHLAGV